jgi:hypothetical protein
VPELVFDVLLFFLFLYVLFEILNPQWGIRDGPTPSRPYLSRTSSNQSSPSKRSHCSQREGEGEEDEDWDDEFKYHTHDR